MYKDQIKGYRQAQISMALNNDKQLTERYNPATSAVVIFLLRPPSRHHRHTGHAPPRRHQCLPHCLLPQTTALSLTALAPPPALLARTSTLSPIPSSFHSAPRPMSAPHRPSASRQPPLRLLATTRPFLSRIDLTRVTPALRMNFIPAASRPHALSCPLLHPSLRPQATRIRGAAIPIRSTPFVLGLYLLPCLLPLNSRVISPSISHSTLPTSAQALPLVQV